MARGFFAIGIENVKSEVNIGSLWRSAHLLGAAYVFTVGRRYRRRQDSDTMDSTRHVPIFHFFDIENLVTHLPAYCAIVGVELHPHAIPLADVTHPEAACYLLGAEDIGLTTTAIAACHAIVKLPGDRSMNVACAGSIVAYDRVTRGAQAAAAAAASRGARRSA